MYLKPTTVYGSLIPGSEFIRSLVRQGTMSKDAAKRLSWFDFYNRWGDARLTCRHFAISPQTFYRWKNRFDPYDLTTLEATSRRPHHVRKPVTPALVEDRILKARLKYPRWGKDKIVVLIRREGVKFGDIANNVPIGHNGAGSYPWTVGAYSGGPATVGPGYKVRIRPANSQSPMDASNGAFAIEAAAEPPAPGQPSTPGGFKRQAAAMAQIPILIQEPTKTSVWTIGETHTIRWHAADRVNYPLSIFLVSADRKIPIVDIGKSVPLGPFRPMEKTWTVTDNLYDGQYCIRITSADRAYEQHSMPFTIKASKTATYEVLPSAVYNKVHWHTIVSGDIWPGEKFHGDTSSIPDPGGKIIKYGFQRWYDDADNYGYTLHRSFVFFNLEGVVAKLKGKYTVKGAWINWKKAANSPQACAPNMWCLDAKMVVGDGSNMFGPVFAAFPKHLLTGDLQIQIQMAQQWLGDPVKNYGLVINAANEGQKEQNGQCVQFCDNVVMKIEIEEKLNK